MIKMDRETKIELLKAIRDGEIAEERLKELLQKLGAGDTLTVQVIDSRDCVGCEKKGGKTQSIPIEKWIEQNTEYV
jgi:hypothetical protein